jgi:uncharacterized protein YprB with RNaseH-like and TPR domain
MVTAYLDIETNYTGRFNDRRLFKDFKNHQITVAGIRILARDDDSFVQLVEAQVSREALLAALRAVDRIVTYNGRSFPDRIHHGVGFDLPVIAAQTGIVLDERLEHLDLCPACWERNLYGGQKAVERMLGLQRKFPARDGLWAMETWRKWKATGQRRYLTELLEYNREDVYMLREVEEALGRLR